MYPRTLSKTIHAISDSFPVLLVTGPRQVGKTTLLEICAKEGLPTQQRAYVTLDDMDARALARRDPALFLQTWQPPLVIDEIQYAPELFSAIKIMVDRDKRNGLFWLTGSQKFELMRGMTESLAGRVAIVDLLGLSQAERDGRAAVSQPFLPTAPWITAARAASAHAPKPLMAVFQQIWLGSFPRLIEQGAKTRDLFYRSYIQTYIQRDVQDVLKVSDQLAFNRFLAAVAARTGQLLNYANLARDVDIDNKTAKAWLSVLETSGLVFLLQPYHTNLTKRMVKTPKLYFLDTGLAAYLTKWPDAASLEVGSMSGAMLETWVVSEIIKSYWHNGLEATLYFYRDTDQQEVDLLIASGDTLYPVEIKKTASPSQNARRQFAVLDKLGKTIGPGAVLCLVERDIPLSPSVTAVPVGYL
ncbi:MAG: ATPase [Comamonadaceae bacterium CG_4_9_14_0_8_um_filter_60_18]|nr:MAG: ATPase [Comamonadaceae bacterium CG2_30_60_41]PIW08671.1 MAG: ATPase [Comamonadaceae bacterium CG17_big_fil_post_rev_8_21_14_2_50_60_13]PJC15568.1 MAG: ATPase [Comamonadaceae bacterium CG_4_9_14_0_8_um_filter_60_18]